MYFKVTIADLPTISKFQACAGRILDESVVSTMMEATRSLVGRYVATRLKMLDNFFFISDVQILLC